MKGKKKLILMLFAIIALVATSAVFAFKDKVQIVPFAQAADIDGFSAELEGGAIFSAERVYFAEDKTTQLSYNGADFNAINTNTGVQYFMDYGLYRPTDKSDYSHKDVIVDGDFVMVDDTAVYTTSDNTSIKQGIMITLGGYYYNSVSKQIELNGDTSGANMGYVSVQATLNGELIELPSSRTYSSEYQDFTWFITPQKDDEATLDVNESTEGHYEITMLYMINGNSLRYEFDFYLLLQSSYEQDDTINGQSYSTKPTMENVTQLNSTASHLKYAFFSGTELNYPMLTFDYSRYDLSYTYVSGDVQQEIDFNYDEINNMLTLSTTVYSDTKVDQYPIQLNSKNTIVTLMFVEHGKYDFKFDYIYKYQNEDIVIPENQLDFASMTLDIHGYQLKYSKAGYNSADMTYLEIYQNGTMFILVNGFTDADSEQLGSALGVNYKLITDSHQKTGKIATSSETANIIRTDNESEDIDYLIENDLTAFVEGLEYQRTDRGLWLTLNDEYYLANNNVAQSYYYYHPTKEMSADFIAGNVDVNGSSVDNGDSSFNRVPFNNITNTTFTQTGYYLVQVKYIYKNENDEDKVGAQYFAFQITSTTPMLQLYKTEEESYNTDIVGTNFYAHEYTNQNVYATWAETGIFESKVSGKLYYSTGKYPTESDLKAVADGVTSSSISKVDYGKNTLLTNSGSYMLVLEVEKSSTKTYTYFTIDKEKISGLKVYEVVTNSIDNKAIYSIKRDSDLNYITHTSKGVIDANFTLSWADKNSGANISASYKFTPFVKNRQSHASSNTIIEVGTQTYKYIMNEYSVGETSNDIIIEKPLSLNSALNMDNVLTEQGIYEFTLVDDAGNVLKYIMIVDRTEGIVNATYGEDKTPYISGEMVADYVELEWGTHKAINLLSVATSNSTISKLLNNQNITDYYIESGNNFFNVVNLFRQVAGNNLFVVQHAYTEIKLRPFDANLDNYYMITNNGTMQIKYPNGAVSTGWDSLANNLFENVTNMGIKINLDEQSIRRYSFEVVGENQVTTSTNTNFQVSITPDKAQGAVYSASQDGDEFATSVRAAGKNTEYLDAVHSNESVYVNEYYEGQASNDGVFVFEWLVPSDEDNFEVTEVKYNYYQLMDQTVLNGDDINKDTYVYYPYKYISTNYILRTESGVETSSQYAKVQRGNDNVYRSNAINLGYETYYDKNGDLVSKKVTQTGMYIITRTISIKSDESETAQSSEFSYVFFVDRNAIVGYSISNINEKIVGQFIHMAMPNSDSATGVTYDNFTKQGLKSQTREYIQSNGTKESIEYKVYLETNKLPTRVQVPSGKYVSGNVESKEIKLTSYINLKLKFSVYFLDTYNLLSAPYSGSFIKLMDNMTINEDGYIDLSFANIDNPGIMIEFRNARIHNEDNSLSLPGVYVFVIEDTVSSNLDDNFEVIDTNNFIFGVKLTNQAPTTDVYAYAQIGDNSSDKVYVEGLELYTNQEFVDFEIEVEDKNSYNAQLDIKTIEVWRKNSTGLKSLWLRLKPSGEGFVADASGIIQDTSRVSLQDNKYIIKLDTGLKVENGQIVSYDEYMYEINIKYALSNSGTKYYTYKDEGVIETFYMSTYTVNIDRSPNSANLDKLMERQGNYFENYYAWLAEQNDTEISGEMNKEFAYRSQSTVGDYYGLINSLYYQFVESGEYGLASQAMYAINVNSSTTFSKNGLSRIYYRALDFDLSVEASTRMGLLPISDTYFGNSTGFYTFSENLTAYQSYPLTNINENVVGDNIYYRALLGDVNAGNYGNNCGKYYEIVEKDLAGNYTQYVIYFAPNEASDITLDINGTNINKIEAEQTTLTFKNSEVEQTTFIGIDNVDSVANLVGKISNEQRYPYYANINIYNSTGIRVKTIYTNSTSKHSIYDIDGKVTQNGIENEIYEVIKEQGNYILELINVYSERFTTIINNYTSDRHQLNSATLQVKTDYAGQKYITLSSVNTRIDANTYWYVTQVAIEYTSKGIVHENVYTAHTPINGKTALVLNSGTSNKVVLDENEEDRLNLASGIQYLVTLTDVAGKTVTVPLSTSEDYYAYKLITPNNIYERDNVVYTANEVKLSYNTDFYAVDIKLYIDGNTIAETLDTSIVEQYYTDIINGNYSLLTLKPDTIVDPANHYGSLRKFVVTLLLKGEASQTYEVWIDTRVTDFNIENTNKVDKIAFVKSTLNNNGTDYNIIDLRASSFYTNLIAETVNISWTRITSDYFTYNYELFEFINQDEYNELLINASDNTYSIAPKDSNTGKYILKVTIQSKDNTWIATRVYGIYMSTTITGLYEVKDGNGELHDYSSITDLSEVMDGVDNSTKQAMATALGFGTGNTTAMTTVFESFGYKTAIPMYISNSQLTLHSNQDNGVEAKAYELVNTSYSKIWFYHIYRSNYRTFAIIMEVYQTNSTQDILSVLSIVTSSAQDGENLLSAGTSKTIYNANAEYYKLKFNSYNKNMGTHPLEHHNKIIIDVYYNNKFVKSEKGGNISTSEIEFKHSGSYKLEIRDVAGNVQYFRTQTSTLDNFTVVVMKDILYTINGEAPIQYAYYDKSVTLQINRYNDATGRNNYDINSIRLSAVLNGKNYTGYTHPTESATYTFDAYGTYVITISAKLLGTENIVTSQLVFTILNPNEARTALDFTSIYGYNIISVFSITKTAERDVTDKFMDLLQDKSNTAGANVYNKLVTYERVVEAFATSTQGKMKFRVLYEADDDDLLPARRAEFSFTLNNETATITSSIKAGGKTTKTVTLKFNAANIYDQIGECNLVINGEKVLRIDENSTNRITQLEIKNVGHYYIQLVGDSGNVAHSFNFTIKEPLNTVAIILIVIVAAIVIGLVGTFIWLRTRMKVR